MVAASFRCGSWFWNESARSLESGPQWFYLRRLGYRVCSSCGTHPRKFLRVRGNSSYLITAGTAICGGSAIAAIAPILHADEEEMAVSLGTVFVLNSVALLIFPPLGHLLGLSQTQFGLWAALAVHDTSPFLLSRRGCKHLSSDVYSIFQISLSTGAARPYGNTFSDRKWWHLSRNPPARWLASSCARHSSLDGGWSQFALLHLHRLDRTLDALDAILATKNYSASCRKLPGSPSNWPSLAGNGVRGGENANYPRRNLTSPNETSGQCGLIPLDFPISALRT